MLGRTKRHRWVLVSFTGDNLVICLVQKVLEHRLGFAAAGCICMSLSSEAFQILVCICSLSIVYVVHSLSITCLLRAFAVHHSTLTLYLQVRTCSSNAPLLQTTALVAHGSQLRNLSCNSISPAVAARNLRQGLCLLLHRHAPLALQRIHESSAEGLRVPVECGFLAGPDADAQVLCCLRVVVQIRPQWQDYVRDAGSCDGACLVSCGTDVVASRGLGHIGRDSQYCLVVAVGSSMVD